MRFAADPVTLAVALGLLGPAALGRVPDENARRACTEEDDKRQGSRSCHDLCDCDLDLDDDTEERPSLGAS